MTLVEVVVAMLVFTIAAAGLMAATLQSRRIAELNVMDSTARTIAQGCLEQIKSLAYAELGHPSTLALVHPEDTSETITLTKDAWTPLPRGIDYNRTPDNPHDDLIIELRASLVHLLTAPGAPVGGTDCYEIRLDYRFQSQAFGPPRWHEGAFRMIRSAIRN